MNQDPPWERMVQHADSSFEEFLADVNVDDFNDIDFTGLEKDNGMLGFDGSGRMDGGAEGRFVGVGTHQEAMNDKGRFGGRSQVQGWNGPAGVSMSSGYMPVEAAMGFQQSQSGHHMRQHQHHAQYGTIPRPAAVPPTPNSLEMHGKQPTYPIGDPQHARVVYENYMRKQQDQMVFTPLVSPAVTPLDSQFQIPEYAVPGEYFTPLTSPAMQAQSSHQRSVYGSVRGSDTSEAASPSDMEIDTTSPALAHATLAQASKGKNPAKTKPIPRPVRHSPAMKAQRKKAPTSATIAAKDVVDIMEEIVEPGSSGSSRPGSWSLPLPGVKTSESSSISPEPLSEILMPPPATSRSSKGRSSHLASQDSAPQGVAKNSPATPATLMRLQNAEGKANQPTSSAPPQRATPAILPNLPNLRNLPASSEEATTPTLAAAGGDGRSSAPPKNIRVPPNPGPSAAGSGTPRAAPKGKKRNSSTQPSPALRPKISPNIKPLLPEGTRLSPETSALLLASKSNYQNILEGNHLPGVTYPNALSVNLTSKRTSHKLAEQGRRNRMNSALQELASLLPTVVPPSPNVTGREKGAATGAMSPPSKTMDRGAGSPPAKGGDKTPTPNPASKEGTSSKASTVEMAIEFIKALQGELGIVKVRLAAAEQALGRAVESPRPGSSSETCDKSVEGQQKTPVHPVEGKDEIMKDDERSGSKEG